jgi:hypothetical protein
MRWTNFLPCFCTRILQRHIDGWNSTRWHGIGTFKHGWETILLFIIGIMLCSFKVSGLSSTFLFGCPLRLGMGVLTIRIFGPVFHSRRRVLGHIVRFPHTSADSILDRWKSIHPLVGMHCFVRLRGLGLGIVSSTSIVSPTMVRSHDRSTINIVADRHGVFGRMMGDVVLRAGMLGHRLDGNSVVGGVTAVLVGLLIHHTAQQTGPKQILSHRLCSVLCSLSSKSTFGKLAIFSSSTTDISAIQ